MSNNASNSPQSLLGGMIFGGIFFLAGSFIVLIATDIIHADPSSFNAPRWVVAAAGGVFMLAGMMVAVQGGFGPEGMKTKLYLWIQFFFGMALMVLFTAIPLWIGFGLGEREFNTSTTIGPITNSSSGSDGMGRFVFGGSGVLMIFITIAMAISQLKNIFKIK